MGLLEYNRKRRFEATPEPRGAGVRARAGERRFVVQLHHARARHYDFRLEVEGVLVSWAVPRGPSFRPGEKRLAMQTEDHPLAYAAFSGTIPEGNYGAGHMAIFDEGTWKPDGDPAEAIRRGRLEFELFGTRLRGRWNLVRAGRPSGRPQWFLLKRTDEYAADLEADDLLADLPVPPEDAPGASTAKGRRILAEKRVIEDAQARAASPRGRAKPRSGGRVVAAGRKAPPPSAAPARRRGAAHPDFAALRRDARTLAGGRRVDAPGEFIEPMLTIAAATAPAGDDWIHEWKWDGYRIIACSGDAPRLWSRNGLDWNARAPELVRALASLGLDATFDGELIAVDAQGYSTFNGLQHALKSKDTAQLRYTVFDLMQLEGHDLRHAPLVERKALLARVLDGADPRLFYSSHVQGRGPEIFEAAREQGMEGIISKRADSAYHGGRSSTWLKVKTVSTRDLVVVGYTEPKGARKGVGALLLAQRSGGKLTYAGRVGSGLNTELLLDLPKRLEALATDTPAVELPAHLPRADRQAHWVRPELVVEVVFRGWSKEGLLRQATFHRLREDKPADQDTNGDERPPRARATSSAAATPRPEPRKSRKRRAPASLDTSDLPTLSSPARVVYPDAGHTKQDVFEYYLAVADRLLPEIEGRLLSVVRCPDGIAGQHFFQKHARRNFGDAVKQATIVENDGDRASYFYIDDLRGLMQLVQMNALEFHPWGSRVETLEQPDRLIFDLDPDPGIAWTDVRRAARDVRDRLAEVGLPSYPRLTGGKGVHVVVPLKPKAGWEPVRAFCEAFADAMTRQEPERFVATMSKAKRRGRIFIDWLRNGRGATGVASWSLRARPGAPAAVPLTWEELARVRMPNRYTLADAPSREVPAFVAELIAKAPVLPLH